MDNEIQLRSIVWVGDSLKRLQKMPNTVRGTIGFQLQAAQAGRKPALAKPLKGIGSGVWEIRSNFQTDTYRAVYAVQIGESIYVLHAFQKKSTKGIATPKREADLIKKRYKDAIELDKGN